MSQQNIDFGSFPDDPSADAIRTAFSKVQNNFDQLFDAGANAAVTSVNQTPGAGITVSSPTGNVVVTANIACVQVRTSTLSVGIGSNGNLSANYTSSGQLLYVDLPTNIQTAGNIQASGFIASNSNISASGNVVGGNLSTSGSLSVTGSANISGNSDIGGNLIVGGSIVGNITGSASTAGTVTTNAQPNITSVGTLNGLSVSGDIIPTANVTYDLGNTTNAFRDLYLSGTTIYIGNSTITANASGVTIATPGGSTVPLKAGGANTQVQYNDDGAFGGHPGLTFDEGNSRFTANNLVATSTANLGAVGNVHITGGTANYVLATNGSGNLSWVAQASGITGVSVQEEGTNVVATANTINFVGNGVTASNVGGVATITIDGASNTTPGGANTQIQYNDNGIFGGNPGLTFDEGNSKLTANNLVATSTANLGAVGNVTITGGTANYVLTTDGAGNLTWANVAGGGAGNIAGGANTQVQYNDNGIFGGHPGMTFDEGNSKLTANNFVATSTANLGDAGNVTITGGNANFVLTTDGTGNLSWAEASTGNANVAGSNTQVQFNDDGVMGADANLTFDKTNGNLTVGSNVVAVNFIGSGANTPTILSGTNLDLIANSAVRVPSNISLYGPNVSLGDVANLHIIGGSNGQSLVTDGNGVLSWADAGGTGGTNLIVQDEGNTLTSTANTINFTGNGVVANNVGNVVTVTINGAAPAAPDYSVQFNDGTGNFGGGIGFRYDQPNSNVWFGKDYLFTNAYINGDFNVGVVIPGTGNVEYAYKENGRLKYFNDYIGGNSGYGFDLPSGDDIFVISHEPGHEAGYSFASAIVLPRNSLDPTLNSTVFGVSANPDANVYITDGQEANWIPLLNLTGQDLFLPNLSNASGNTVLVYDTSNGRVTYSSISNVQNGIAIQDEGTNVVASTTTVNFVGNGVVASNVGGVATITISGSGNGTPAGSNTQVQYNDAGNFGANSGFTFDSTTGWLSAPGNISSNSEIHFGNETGNGNLVEDAWGRIRMFGNASPAYGFTYQDTGAIPTPHLAITNEQSTWNQALIIADGLEGASGTALGFSVINKAPNSSPTTGLESGWSPLMELDYYGNFTLAGSSNLSNVPIANSGTANVGGLISRGISNLNSVSNVIITGGSNGQVLTTNGSGNLSWANASGGISGVAVQEEGTNVVTSANTINFVGNGVTASNVGGIATITIDSGSSNANVAGSNTQVQFNDDGVFGANAGLTFDKSNTVLTANNLTVSSKSNLNSVSNVTILGGTNGYYLQTDGTGNLTWATGSNYSGNGTVAGANTQIQFNDEGNFGAVAGFTFDKTTTIFTANNIVATSTADLGDVANVTILGGSNNFILTTDGTGSLTWANLASSAFANSIAAAGANTQVQYNDDGVLGGNPMFTFDEGLTLLTANNFAATSTANLGDVANIYIGGGNALDVLSTSDGNGTLAWTTLTFMEAAGSNTQVQYNDDGVLGGNPAFTFDESNTLITANNLTVSSITNLGNVANVHIDGGSNNYILTTDGSGNLSWSNGSSITDVAAAGANTQIQYNDDGVLGGNPTFTFDELLSLVTVNNFAVTSTANLGAVSNVTITGGAGGQVLSTDGNGILSWSNATGGITGIAIQEEGTNVVASANTINFVGNGVTASNVGGIATITIDSANVSAAGNTTEVQFNNAGSLDADANFAYAQGGLWVGGVSTSGNASGIITAKTDFRAGSWKPTRLSPEEDVFSRFRNQQVGAASTEFYGFTSDPQVANQQSTVITNESVLTSAMVLNEGVVYNTSNPGDVGTIFGISVNNGYANDHPSTGLEYGWHKLMELNNWGNLGIGGNLTINPDWQYIATQPANNEVGIVFADGTFQYTAATGASITIQDEGSNVVTNATIINFVGNTVTASNIGGVATVTIEGSSEVANANYANFAGTAFSVSGSNVSGEVANANYATYAGTAYSVDGANVNGEVANANYATYAGTAFSVDGANVNGEVANANYATYAGTAFSVDGANVNGEVANANYSTYSGTANTSGSANTVNINSMDGNIYYITGAFNTFGSQTIHSTSLLTYDSSNNTLYAANANIGNVYGIIRPTSGTGTNGIIFPANPGGGSGDLATIQYYAATGEDTVLELAVTNDSNDIIKLNATGGTTVTNTLTADALVTVGNATIGNHLTVTTGGATITGNLDVTGNLNVTGNLIYQNIVDLVVDDPLIYLAANNTGNLYDLGFVASFVDSYYQHTGFARDHNTGIWRLFTGLVSEPTTTIDWANSVYAPFAAGSITSDANINATGNVSANNLNSGNDITAGGNVSGERLLGNTLYVTNDANVGNLGTGGFIIANGNITGSQLISTIATGTAPLVVTSTTRVANLNVGYANVADFINVNTVTTGTFYPILANALSGNVEESANANLTFNAATGALSATLLTGTLTTAAQPNITSVGTLTGLNVSGNVSFTGSNVSLGAVGNLHITGGSNNYILTTDGSGNLRWGDGNTIANVKAGGSDTQIQYNDNGILGGNPGMTFNEGTTTLTANNFVATSRANLGAVGNVYIGGGSPLQILATIDGAGNLAWATIETDNAAGSDTQVQYNDNGILGGNPGFTFNEGTTTVTANNFVATSTANLGAVGNVYIGGGNNGEILTTNGSGVLSWSNTITTTGNVSVGNIIASGYHIRSVATGITATGTTQANAVALTKEFNLVATVSSGTGVVLPTAVAGMAITVINKGSNALNVYPAVNAAINSASANAAYSQPVNGTIQYIALTTSQWYTVGGTYA